jgi:transcriptional regulator with XRE-family HTH domain
MSIEQDFVEASKAFVEAKGAAARAEAAMLAAYNALTKASANTDIDLAVSELQRQSYRRNAVAIERKKRCWTQKRLGIALGFKPDDAQPRISQMETGERVISDNLLKSIAEVFGETAEWLEAVGREHASRRAQKILEVLRLSRVPVSIAALSDRLGLSTSEGWAELEPLVNDCRVLKVPGGFVIANEEAP